MAEISVTYQKVVVLPSAPYVPNAFYLLSNGSNADQYLATADGTALKAVINTPAIQTLIDAAIVRNGGGGGGSGVIIDLDPVVGHTDHVPSSDGVARSINITNSNVTTLSGNITGLSGQILTLNGQVSSLSSGITSIDGQITTLTGQINSATSQVTTLSNSLTTTNNNLTTTNNNLTTTNNNLATTNSNLGNKVDKVTGQGLSTNNYDNTEKTKVTNATTHVAITSGNPHGTTPAQIGLGNVLNVNTVDPNNIAWTSARGTLSTTERTQWSGYATTKQDKLVDGTNLSTINGISLQSGTPITVGSGVSIDDTTPSTSSVFSSTKVNSLLTGKVSTTLTVNGKALSTNITLNNTDIGLGNVTNLDYRDPNNITWTATRGTVSSTERTQWNGYTTTKQDKLVDGTNISTINGISLQSGTPITIGSGVAIDDTTPSGTSVFSSNKVNSLLSAKVATSLTINSHALTANISLTSTDVGLGSVANVDCRNPNNIIWTTSRDTISSTERTQWNSYSTGKQDKLVDGTNLSTINGISLQSGTPITIGSGVSINDTTASTTTVFSSTKVNSLLSGKITTGAAIPATTIATDTTHLFVTTTEKATWNAGGGGGGGSSDFWVSAKVTGGAVGDGVADDSAELLSQFTSNNIVYLPVGVYLLTSTISISGVSNLKIIGTKSSKITSTLKTLISMTNCNNIEIVDIIFETTASDTTGSSDTTNALIKINGGSNIRISDNTFNATNAVTDAIRIIVDDTHVVSNLRVTKNNFNGIGQRGIEVTSSAFVNKNFTDSYIENNWFNNIGAKNATNGQAICIRAYSTRIKISNNEIKDANNIGIECDGVEGLGMVGNDMYSITRSFIAFKVTNATTGKTTLDLVLSHSVISVQGAADNSILLQNLTKFSILSNNFNAGAVVIKGTKGRFNNNAVWSSDQRCISIIGTSDALQLMGNYLDNTAATTPLEPVVTDSTLVTNIIFNDNDWKSATGNAGSSLPNANTQNNSFTNVWGA